MIKITFEFPHIDAAVAFLRKGKLPNTNETVGVLSPTVEGAKGAIEALAEDGNIAEAEAEPVRKRKSRVGVKVKPPHEHRTLKKKSSPKKAKPISDKITDADLAKAASIAAEAITPALVMAFLEQLGVGDVSELKGDERREFLDLLDEEVEAERKCK